MTESALVIVISLLSAIFAATVWNSLSAKSSRDTSVNLLMTCFRAFLDLQTKGAWLALPFVGLLLFVGFAIVRPYRDTDPCSSSWTLGTWVTLSFMLGALASLLQQRIVGFANMKLAIGGAARFRSSSQIDQKSITLRVSLLSPLFSAVIALVVPTSAQLIGAHLLTSATSSFDASLLRSPFLIVSYVLGIALSSLIFQVQAGLLRSSAIAGARSTTTPLAEDDARNPVAAALAVARLLAPTTTASVDVFASTSLAVCASLIHGASLATSNKYALPFGASALSFPAVVMAFGLVSSTVGVLVIRQGESDSAPRAFDRGLLVSLALTIAAIGGASRWLFDALWYGPFGAASFGAMGVYGLTVLSRKLSGNDSVNAAAFESTGRHDPLCRVKGISHGALSASAMAASVFLLLGLGGLLGHFSGLNGGVVYGMTCVLAGIVAPSVYLVSQLAATTLLPFYASLETLLGNGASGKTRQNAPVYMSSYLWLVSIVSAVVLALGLESVRKVFSPVQPLAWASIGPHMSWGLTSIVIVGTVLFLGLLWRAFASSTLAVSSEVERHFHEAREKSADDELAGDYDPEHRACFDLVSAEAVRSSASPLLLALGQAAVVAATCRLVFLNNLGEGTATPLIGGVFALGLFSAFLDTTSAVWHGHWIREKQASIIRKTAVDERGDSAKNPINGAAVASDTVGDMFRHLTVPSIHAMMKVLVTATVVLAPLFQ